MTQVVVIGASTHTLRAEDDRKTLVFTAVPATTLTVPPGLSAEFECLIVQEGGQITFAGTFVNRQNHTQTAGLHAVASLTAIEEDLLVLAGDTA